MESKFFWDHWLNFIIIEQELDLDDSDEIESLEDRGEKVILLLTFSLSLSLVESQLTWIRVYYTENTENTEYWWKHV